MGRKTFPCNERPLSTFDVCAECFRRNKCERVDIILGFVNNNRKGKGMEEIDLTKYGFAIHSQDVEKMARDSYEEFKMNEKKMYICDKCRTPLEIVGTQLTCNNKNCQMYRVIPETTMLVGVV